MCALIGSPFKTRKPRQFNYNPRYYDPDKEAREQRRRELLGPDADDRKDDKEYHPGRYVKEMRLRRGIVAERRRQGKSRSGLIRLALLVGLAALILWYLYG